MLGGRKGKVAQAGLHVGSSDEQMVAARLEAFIGVGLVWFAF